MKNNQYLSLLFMCCAVLGCAQSRAQPSGGGFTRLGVNDLASSAAEHPAFAGFGQFLLPGGENPARWGNMELNAVDALLPYHNNVNPHTTVAVLNYLIDQVAAGNTVFYDIYNRAQKEQDPSKNNTGLFFFRGKPGAPFAVVCAGGGFSYVGSIHEAFPHALELSKKGYNAFAVHYRTGSERRATEDLAAALAVIFAHPNLFGVNTDSYSLWGSSAGARMVANIGSDAAAYGGGTVPKPAAVITAYTGHQRFSSNDSPTFAVVGENDGIASPAAMQNRLDAMSRAGISTELRIYKNTRHGFGLGLGTAAEGWLDEAVRFWQ